MKYWPEDEDTDYAWSKPYQDLRTPREALRDNMRFVGCIISVMVIAVALLNWAGSRMLK